MKSRLKDKIKLGAIVLASVVAVILFVSIISGRISTQEIVLVKNDGININLPLDQQLEFFEIKEFSKKEAKAFGNAVVTDFSQLMNKRVTTPLIKGSPIPLSMLVEPNSGGAFAAKLGEGRTTHHFPSAAVGLPPIEKGDKINVGLTFQDKNELGETIYLSTIILYDLEVVNIIGLDLYVDVSLQESVYLNNAKKTGEFFFQLPGKLDIPLCSELDKLDINVDCLPEYYLPDVVSQSEIIKTLKNGEAFNLTERQLIELIETINESTESEKQEDADKNNSNNQEEENADSNSNIDDFISNLNDDESTNNNSVDGCVIVKGNLDTNQYYLPDDPDYDEITNYEEFCSEEEAESAGYSSSNV